MQSYTHVGVSDCEHFSLSRFSNNTHMAGSEKSGLPCTQQQEILFTIKRQMFTLTNNSGILVLEVSQAGFTEACF